MPRFCPTSTVASTALLMLAVAVISNQGTAFTTTKLPEKLSTMVTRGADVNAGSSRLLSLTGDTYDGVDSDDERSGFNGSSRRAAMVRSASAVASFLAATTLRPEKADALKKRNEALCGTGFFEHIYEYKCTEIGDIEDEGISKAMSSSENGLTDGLMGKLGLEDSGEDPFSTDVSYNGKKKAEPKKKKKNNNNNISVDEAKQ